MYPKATILFCACWLGNIVYIGNQEQGLIKNNQIMRIIDCPPSVEQVGIENFANILSAHMINHKIYCSPLPQVANEIVTYTNQNLISQYGDTCDIDNIKNGDSEGVIYPPVPFQYASDRQIVYEYIHTPAYNGSNICDKEEFRAF